jgi:hypothetical protein
MRFCYCLRRKNMSVNCRSNAFVIEAALPTIATTVIERFTAFYYEALVAKKDYDAALIDTEMLLNFVVILSECLLRNDVLKIEVFEREKSAAATAHQHMAIAKLRHILREVRAKAVPECLLR